MTNANFPDRWLADRRFRRLSDTAFRSYVLALTYAVSNRTEGVIDTDDLALIPDFNPKTIPELVGNDLWEPRLFGESWFILDFPATQTGRDLLASMEQRKAWDRNRKARQRNQRLADNGDSGGSSDGQVPVERSRPDQTRPDQTTNASSSKAGRHNDRPHDDH
jgi:hypothetical protein